MRHFWKPSAWLNTMLSLPAGLRTALGLMATVRLPWLLLMVMGMGWLSPGPASSRIPELTGPEWAKQWMAWDSGWYMQVVREGYSYAPCKRPEDPCAEASISFFPALVGVLATFKALNLPVPLASFAFNLLCLLLALWALYELAKHYGHDEASRRRAQWAMLLMPATVFFSAGYPEAMFAALGLTGLLFLQRGQPAWASLFLALGTVTRPHGIVLVACMVIDQLARRRWRGAAIVAAGTAILFGAYMFWQHHRFDDPLASFHARRAWGFEGWVTVRRYWQSTVDGSSIVTRVGGPLDFFSVPLLVVCGLLALRRYGLGMGLYAIGLVALPLSQGQVMSMGRSALGILPVFLVIADLTKSPWAQRLGIGIGLTWATMNGLMFVNGYWVS